MIQAVLWLLPPCAFKNHMLRRFGHAISNSASIGPSIVWKVQKIEIGEGARMGLLNVVRGVSYLHLGDGAMIESWNWISAHPVYQNLDDKAGTLHLGYRAKVGSRNYIDCSGTVVIRDYAHLGGNRCFLQTHQADYLNAKVGVGRITIGHHAAVGSCAVLLKGAALPDQSLLAANSTLLAHSAGDGKRGLYAGSPALWKRETVGAYFDSPAAYKMTDHCIDEQMGVLPEDRL